MSAIIEKSLTEVAAVAYLRGIDNEGNSVKVATNNVTDGLNKGAIVTGKQLILPH